MDKRDVEKTQFRDVRDRAPAETCFVEVITRHFHYNKNLLIMKTIQ